MGREPLLASVDCYMGILISPAGTHYRIKANDLDISLSLNCGIFGCLCPWKSLDSIVQFSEVNRKNISIEHSDFNLLS